MSETNKVWALVSNREESKIVYGTKEDIYNKKIFVWDSMSRRYDTKEDLIKGEGILDKPCKICGGLVKTNWHEPTKQKLIESNICFDCDFWMEKIKIKDDPKTVRVEGTHYWIEADRPKGSSFLGFGGAEFNIRFNDGRFVTSHNLWCQGDIPAKFKDQLPDNAVFVEIQHPEREKLFNALFPKS